MAPDLPALLPADAICPPCCPQVLSPMSAGLFHRAISQSGIITNKILKEINPWPEAQVCLSFTLLSSVGLKTGPVLTFGSGKERKESPTGSETVTSAVQGVGSRTWLSGEGHPEQIVSGTSLGPFLGISSFPKDPLGASHSQPCCCLRDLSPCEK